MNPSVSADRTSRILAILALVAALGFLTMSGLRTIAQPAFWDHLATGRQVATQGVPHADTWSFTAAGETWIAPSWLYDGLLFRLWNAGGPALVIGMHAAAAALAFGLLLLPARRHAGATACALALLLCTWIMLPVQDVSPAVFALPFAALAVFLLHRAPRPAVLFSVLIPLQILWINLHPSGLVGPVLVLFAAAAALYDPGRLPAERRRNARRLGVLAGVLALATLVNPYGAALHRFILTHGDTSALIHPSGVLSPLAILFPPAATRRLIVLALFVGAGGLIVQKQRLPIVSTASAVFGGFLVVQSVTHLPIFTVLVFPFLALSMQAVGESLSGVGRRTPRDGGVWAMAPAFVALATAIGSIALFATDRPLRSHGLLSRPGLGVTDGVFPQGAAEAVALPDFPDRMLHAAADGGFLFWTQPAMHVFCDLRPGLYRPEFTEMLDRFVGGDTNAAPAMITRWKTGAALLPCLAPGAVTAARALLDTGEWAMAYFDGAYVVLLRKSPAVAPLLADPTLQKRGLALLEADSARYAADLNAGRRPPFLPRLIGGALMFGALDRNENAGMLWELLTRGEPAMQGARLNLAIARAKTGRTEDAVPLLERYTKESPKNPQGWYWLGVCHTRAGRTKDAAAASEHLKELLPAKP